MTQIDDVKSRLDIVEVISSYVNLQRSGSSLKANCPFHQERTPSFFVFPDRQSWRCFGACAEGGDAFSFVMKADRVEFREALQRLAARVGVTLVNNEESRSNAHQLFEINDAARRFYQQMLATPEAGFVRDYLERRGISERSIQTFEIGYSPPRDNRLLAHLTQAGYERELIAQAGLARETDDGRHYDLFRGRLMIPIRDWEARVAGFGSRALDEEATPKYLNTPRTPVFDKSRILYAMHLAKEPIRQHGAVIVEGYMDAIMAHQHGYDNVVASMGTALTERQVALVDRLTKSVTMTLDGDAAGSQATIRSLWSSWGAFQARVVSPINTPFNVGAQSSDSFEFLVAELPSGMDPDDFIRTSPGDWPSFLDSATPLFDYLLAAYVTPSNMDNIQARTNAAHILLRFVAQIPDPITRDLYMDRLSAKLNINVETLHANLPIAGWAVDDPNDKNERARVASTADQATPRPVREYNAVEEALLAFLLQHGIEPLDGYETAPSEEWFSRSENREIYRSVIAGEDVEEIPVPPELQTHLESLRGRELRLSTQAKRDKAWRQMSLALEKEHLNNEIKQLSSLPEIMEDIESPMAQQLLHDNIRIGEIDRLLKPTSPNET